jgi:hypothetical protein
MLVTIRKIMRSIVRKVLAAGGLGPAAYHYHDHFYRDNIMRQCFIYIRTNLVEGDYLHFGVGSGADFISSYECYKPWLKVPYTTKSGNIVDTRRHFYAFDSFQGIPSPQDEYYGKYNKGGWSYSRESFVKRLNESNIPAAHYTIIEGYYEDVLTEDLRKSLPLEKAAIVVFDCDLYESTMSALRFVYPYLQSGTLLLMAEYFNYGGDFSRGMARAVSDYLEEQGGKCRFNPWKPYGTSGMVFIFQKPQDKIKRGA